MRILGPALLSLVLLLIWVYALVDIIATDSKLTRRLPKWFWLAIVLLTAGVGAIAWLAFGRPLNAGWTPGDTRVRQRRRFQGPEDRDEWERPSGGSSAPRPNASDADSARRAHPAGEASRAARAKNDLRDSPAARERRRMEYEAQRARGEPEIPDDDTQG